MKSFSSVCLSCLSIRIDLYSFLNDHCLDQVRLPSKLDEYKFCSHLRLILARRSFRLSFDDDESFGNAGIDDRAFTTFDDATSPTFYVACWQQTAPSAS